MIPPPPLSSTVEHTGACRERGEGLNRFTMGLPLRYDPGAYGPARPPPHSARRPVPGSPAVRRPSHAGLQPLVDVAPPCGAALQPAGAEHLVALSEPGGPAPDRDQLEAARRRRELHRRVPRRDGSLRALPGERGRSLVQPSPRRPAGGAT